jgi:hypothetical protein
VTLIGILIKHHNGSSERLKKFKATWAKKKAAKAKGPENQAPFAVSVGGIGELNYMLYRVQQGLAVYGEFPALSARQPRNLGSFQSLCAPPIVWRRR